MKYDYKNYIAAVKDFPVDGIVFRDITPLMANGQVFKAACDELTDFAREVKAEVIAGPESRGFIFGCPIASNLEIGFVPIRKPNKLPRETIEFAYELEYGKNCLCIHKDAISKGQRVVLVDDLLATGGTINAAIQMIEKLGGIVVGLCFLIELSDLNGRDVLEKYSIKTLMQF